MQTSSARTDRNNRAAWLTGLLLMFALTPLVAAQAMRDLVEAALDQPLAKPVEIPEKPIRQALADVEQATGLRFTVANEAIDWMPYGEQTRVAIVMKDMPVRAALTRIFDGLGLSLRVQGDKVAIEPSPMLGRLARRLTLDEVGLLDKLAHGPWSALKPSDFTIQYRMAPEGDPQKSFEAAMREGNFPNALVQLEDVTQRLGWLWVLNGKTIVLYSHTEDIQQRLDRPVDLNYRKVPLDDMLMDLGKRIDITVHLEPGVLKALSARERNVDLIQRNITGRQVLELIAGNTGVHFDVVDDGVVLYMPKEGGTTTGAESTGDNKVVAIVRVPVGTDGTTVEFLIRASELPAEFKQLRDQKMPQVIELLKQQLGEKKP